MGHEVIVSAYWGLSGAPTQWNGITILPGFGANYCSTSLSQHCKAVQPDLVITLGDVWVLDRICCGRCRSRIGSRRIAGRCRRRTRMW